MAWDRIRIALWVIFFFTMLGVLSAMHMYLGDLEPTTGTAVLRLMTELTSSYSSLLLLPLLLLIAKIFPFTQRRRMLSVLGNIGGFIVFTLAHTTLLAISRNFIAPLISLQNYTYDNLPHKYPMEAGSDAIFYPLLMTIIYLLISFNRKRILETQLAEARLENLRLQLHPHFLFNTLNAISSVMYEDVGKADEMLAKLGDFLRSVLELGSIRQVPIHEELAIEQMYVDIMTLRLERRIELNVEVQGEVSDISVPPMLLQPLIENSIRHGMGSSRATLNLDILVSRNNGSAVIILDDNGLGVKQAVDRGIGLNNVASRLQLTYGETASFALAPGPEGGARATLRFPYDVRNHQ